MRGDLPSLVQALRGRPRASQRLLLSLTLVAHCSVAVLLGKSSPRVQGWGIERAVGNSPPLPEPHDRSLQCGLLFYQLRELT